MSVEKAKKLDSLQELQKLKSELNNLQNQARGFKTEKEVYTYIDKNFSSFDKDLKTTWSKATIQGKSEFKIYDPKTKQEKIYYIEGPFFITGDKNKFAERSTSTFIKKIELLSQKIDEIFDKNDNIRRSAIGRSSQDITNLKKYTKAIKNHFDVIKNREIGPMKKIFEDMLIKYQNITSGIDAKYKAGSEYLKEEQTKVVKKLSPKGDYYDKKETKTVNGSESYNQAIDSAKTLLKGKSGKYMIDFFVDQINKTANSSRDEQNRLYIANYINGVGMYIYENLSNKGDTANMLELANIISGRTKRTIKEHVIGGRYSELADTKYKEATIEETRNSELASQICIDIIAKGNMLQDAVSKETEKNKVKLEELDKQGIQILENTIQGKYDEKTGTKLLQDLGVQVQSIGQKIQKTAIDKVAGTNRYNLNTTDNKDLKGSSIEKGAYALYQDINGAGLKLADQTKKNIEMGAALAATIAITIATGGATGSFVYAAMAGTISNLILSGKKYGSIKNFALDVGSEMILNMALGKLGGQALKSLGTSSINGISTFVLGGKLSVKGAQLGLGLADAAANLGAEQLRQKRLGNDINIIDSLTVENPMSWIIALGIISDGFGGSAQKGLNQAIKNGNTQQRNILLQKYLQELENHKAELLKTKQIYQINGKNTTGLDIYNKLVAKTKKLLNNNIDIDTQIQKVDKKIDKTKRQGDKLAGYFDGTAKLTSSEKAIFDKNKNAIMSSGLYDTHTMPGYNNNGKGNLAMSDGRDLVAKRQDSVDRLIKAGVSPDDAKAITTKLMDDGVLGIFDWFKHKNTSEYNNINPKIYNRETARIGIEKVNRSSEVVAIGDLHGEMVAFEGNMKSAGLIDNKGKWSGGNKKIVFHGDILADRGNNSLEIIKKISKLREEAQKQGGDIVVLAGNHEDFLFSFLMSDRHLRGKHGNGLDDSMRDLQGKGLSELAKYIGEKNTNPRIILNEMRKKGNANIEILNAMRNNLEGKQILEEICKMRLVDQIDDGLFLHTNPTEHILETIRYYSTEADGKINIGKGIDKINTIFQKGLRKNLLGTNESVDTSELNSLMDIFLNTNNRRSNTHTSYYNMLKDNGINTIQHGHSGGEEFGGIGEFGGVKIIDNDKLYGKGGYVNGDNSISITKQNGQIEYGINNKINIYNLNTKEGSKTQIVEVPTKLENITTEGSNADIKSTDTTYNNLNTLLESNEDVFLSQFHDRKNNLTDTQKGELKQSYEAKYPGKTLDISESIVAKEVVETIPEPTKSETIPEVIKIDTPEAATNSAKSEVIKLDISEIESDPNFVIIDKSENISDINTNKDYEIHGEIEQYTNDNVFTKGQKYEVNGVEYTFSGIDKDGIYIFESIKGKLKVKEEGTINMLEKTKKAQEIRKSQSTSAEETIFRENNIAQIDQIITKQKVDLEYKKQILQIDKQIKSYDDKITKNNQDITKLEYEIEQSIKQLEQTNTEIKNKFGDEYNEILEYKKKQLQKLIEEGKYQKSEHIKETTQNANKEKINKLQQEIDAINNIINRRDNLTKQIENKTNTLNMKKKLVENDHKLRDKLIQQKTDTQDNIYKNIEIRDKTKEIGEAVDNIKLEIGDEIKKKNAELDINKKEFENSEEYQKAGSDEEKDELMKKKFEKEEQEIIDLEEDLSKVEEVEELLDPQAIDVDPEVIDVDPELKPIKDSKIQKIQNILSHLKNNKYKYILGGLIGGLIGGIIGYNLLSTKKGEDNKYDNEDNESETIVPDSTQAPILSSPTITDNSPQGTPTDSAEVPPVVTPPLASNEVNDAEESKSDNEEVNSNNEENKSNNTNTTNSNQSTKNNPEPVISTTPNSENKTNSSTNNAQSENKKESTNSPNSQSTPQTGTETLTTISVNANSPTNNKENQNQIEEKVSNIEDLPDMTDEIENYPGQAWAKNNNPAGISRNNNFEKGVGFSAKLKEAGIKFEKGTKRPSGEGNYYVKFDTMGDGIAAQKLFWELKNKTINEVLSSYAVDNYSISGIDGNKKYKDLSEDQKNEFILKQIKRESPGLYKEIIERFDGSSELIANNRIKVRTDDVENIDLSTDNSYIGKDGILYDIKSTSEGSIDVIKNKFSDLVKSAKEYFSIFNVFKHESEYGLDIKRSETREFKNILKKLRKNTEDKDIKDGLSIPKIKGYARKPETIPGYDKSLSDQENFDNYIKQLLK